MAITLASARVFNKMVCLNEAFHPMSRRPVLVCTIGCSIEQSASQPNAIIIPVPGKLARTNVIDTADFSGIGANILCSSTPRERKRFGDSIAETLDASAFYQPLFTYAVAENASSIRQTLRALPEASRPHIQDDLLEWLGQNYDKYSFVIAAFSHAGIGHAAPILFWYEPTSNMHLMLPGITMTDGHPPDTFKYVSDDRWVILGSQSSHVEKMPDVRYTCPRIDPFNFEFLPKYVHAARFSGEQLNCDFVGPRQFALHRGPTLLRREMLRLP